MVDRKEVPPKVGATNTTSDSLVALVVEYDRQYSAHPITADRAVLQAARTLLEAQLQSGPVSTELAHLGQGIYSSLGEKATLVELLARYLAQPLPAEEEAWARWLLVDNLAMLRRHEEAVAAQCDFLTWAREALSPDRLFWVMQDGTQSRAWVALGRADEWLTIAQEAAAPKRRRTPGWSPFGRQKLRDHEPTAAEIAARQAKPIAQLYSAT